MAPLTRRGLQSGNKELQIRRKSPTGSKAGFGNTRLKDRGTLFFRTIQLNRHIGDLMSEVTVVQGEPLELLSCMFSIFGIWTYHNCHIQIMCQYSKLSRSMHNGGWTYSRQQIRNDVRPLVITVFLDVAAKHRAMRCVPAPSEAHRRFVSIAESGSITTSIGGRLADGVSSACSCWIASKRLLMSGQVYIVILSRTCRRRV